MRTARPAFFWAVVAAAYSAPTAHSFSGVGLSSAVSAFVSPLHQQRAAGAADAGGAAGAVRMSAVVEPGSFGGNYMPTFGGFAGGSTAAPSVAAAPSAYSVNSPLVDRIAPAPLEQQQEGGEKKPAGRLAHPPASTHSRTTVGKSHGLLDPKLIGAIRDKVGADDPVLSAFFSDFMNEGPLASMHHLGTPGVASRLSALMGEVVTRRQPSSQQGVPQPGWCRRSRFSSL